MKVLFIGGTGNISTSVSKLAVQQGVDLYLLHRGRSGSSIEGATDILGDVNADPEGVAKALDGMEFDAVVNWIAFTPSQVERDIKWFAGKTGQYIFISSASAYQKPLAHPFVTESTPLANPYWEYSRNKIACEEALLAAYRDGGFPAVIVRPSLTYDTVIPVTLGGWTEYTVVDRMKRGKKTVVQGDGTSLWTVTHSRDFAKGFVGLLGHQQAIGHAFHITSDEVLTWDQIYQAVASAAGVEADIVHVPSDLICHMYEAQTGTLLGDKIHSGIFDNTKIKTFVPEFQATIPFKQGIKETLDWFEADPARMVVSEATDAMLDHILDTYRTIFPGA